jgi:hypothetical protein
MFLQAFWQKKRPKRKRAPEEGEFEDSGLGGGLLTASYYSVAYYFSSSSIFLLLSGDILSMASKS